MSDTKVRGTVKWFSNKKGYGFITPADGSPTTEDIFVHQSVIQSEGYRTLDAGWEVEFTIGKDESGKIKAEGVTAPGGGPCTGPRKPRRRRERKGGGSGEEEKGDHADAAAGVEKKGGAAKERKPRNPFWHDTLVDSVKDALDAKDVRRTTGTIDVAFGSARIKLGTKGYLSLAHADGILAEGAFECDADGTATFDWKRAMAFDKSEAAWKKVDEKQSVELPSSISLSDDAVGKVGTDETPETLWGDGPTDPKEALEANEFDMRRVVLTTKRRR